MEVSLVNHEPILWSQSHGVGTVRLLETLDAAEGCHDTLRQWVVRQLRPLAFAQPDRGKHPVALAATGGNIESIGSGT